ncbi:MAG: protein kinase [Paludibacteraceae bacterium]|nr:protein kinase [Paludibacteraceae bacterium]
MAQKKNALPINTILAGRYQIERVIGEGGFGITYYARHLQLGTYVAIKEFFLSTYCQRRKNGKVTFVEITPDKYEKHLKRFQDEARTLCRLNNPHVVSVRDVFNENDTSYIVMDFVAGETLQHKIEREGAMPYDAAVNYMAQLCEAVEHIHSHRILHRDIKPENIIITPSNNVVLIDFGSARSFVHDQEQRHTAMLTVGYAPIEQYTATGKKGNYTDLYAVGGTFYFILTGKKPIPAADRIVNDELVEPRAINPNIPEAANRTIMKALNVKPEDRYQTVQEFRADLLGMKAPDPMVDPPSPTTTPYTPDSTSSSSSGSLVWLWILIPVIIVGAVILAAIIGHSQSRSYENPDSSSYVEPGEVEETRVLPDGYPAIMSERQLEESDLVDMSDWDLKVMRNSVYALYGFRFGKDDLKNYFSGFSWYNPTYTDQNVVFDRMTSIEQYNVKFVREYEKKRKQEAEEEAMYDEYDEYEDEGGYYGYNDPMRRGVIYDSDGWSNLRETPSTSADIVGQLSNGDEILYIPMESGWCEVYDWDSREFIGYVHGSRISSLD